MKIAVINETSAADKNVDILSALTGRGHEVINAGMKERGAQPELQYIHTGLLAAILLNLKKVELIVGGCGTGQGFLNSVMQYPGVFCGHILNSLDAWLFMQINGGNCISLALNQGYGWAGDINLKLIFDNLLSVERGAGYPAHRRVAQASSRHSLELLTGLVHRSFADIIKFLPDEIIGTVLKYPGVTQLIEVDSIKDKELRDAFKRRLLL